MNHQLDIEGTVKPAPTRTSYPGGKGGSGVYQTIINHMPPHEVYLEPFVGGGAILRKKRPARSNIVIDSDASAIAALKQTGLELPIRYLVADGVQFLREWDFKGRELVYCDPPYMMCLRSTQRDLYRQEWTDTDHATFLALARSLPSMVMISGYESAYYDAVLHDWHKITFTGTTRGGPRTECLWMNFPAPKVLHDYQYLGENFRERERIKRKAKRWAAKLASMSALERQAILSECSAK